MKSHELSISVIIFVVVFLTLYNFDLATTGTPRDNDERPDAAYSFSSSQAVPHAGTMGRSTKSGTTGTTTTNVTNNANTRTTKLEVLVTDSIYKGKPSCIECAPVVLERYKLIFFTSAKIGCTVWKQLFRRIMGMDDWQDVRGAAIPHDPKYNGLKYLFDYTPQEATHMMTSSEWTRAVFVRDPKERLLSAYLDKGMPNNGRHVKGFCCTTHDRECRQRVRHAVETFSEFVNLTHWCEDPHWTLQSNRMESKYWPHINFIGHLESAAQDAEVLLRRVGAWDEYGASGWGSSGQNSIFAENQSPHTTGSKNRLAAYYTPQLERVVDFELYRKDYEHAFLGLKIKPIDWSSDDKRNTTHIIPRQLREEISGNITRARRNFTFMPNNDPIYKGAMQCWDCSPIVLEKHKLLFFTVAKAGCTVFKQLFRRIMGYDEYMKEEPDFLHNPRKNGLTYLHHLTPEKAYEFMTSPNWTRALFVRDPKERLLSAYLDKGVRSGGKFVKEKCCGKDDAPMNCREDVNTKIQTLHGFADIVRWCSNPHWAPQSSRIGDPYWSLITFVGHLETAAEDTKKLLTRLDIWESYGASGWGDSRNDSIFASNRAMHSTGANDKVRLYYTPEVERAIEMRFAADYAHPMLNLTMTSLSGR